MDERQRLEIGERIRELRESSPETNRSVADYCSVGERTVAGWVAGAGISYKNAVKVAELFEADIDWLWRGRKKGPTPDPFAGENPQLDRIEQRLNEVAEALGLEQADEAAAEAERASGREQSVPPERAKPKQE